MFEIYIRLWCFRQESPTSQVGFKLLVSSFHSISLQELVSYFFSTSGCFSHQMILQMQSFRVESTNHVHIWLRRLDELRRGIGSSQVHACTMWNLQSSSCMYIHSFSLHLLFMVSPQDPYLFSLFFVSGWALYFHRKSNWFPFNRVACMSPVTPRPPRSPCLKRSFHNHITISKQ